MLNQISILLLAAISLVNSPAKADSGIQANVLLNYFSAGCHSQQEWTRSALTYTSGLVQTLQSLAADPDCKSLSGAIGNINNVTEALENLSRNTNAANLNELNKQEQLYLQLMNQTTKSSEIQLLSSSIQTVQLQIAQQQTYVNLDQSRPYQAFASNAKIILDQASRSPLCMIKHSSVLAGLAGSLGSVGAATLTGGSSLLLASGMDIMNSMIEKGRIHRLNKEISNVDFGMRSAAFSCTLETLSNQYCQSRNSYQILKTVANSQLQSNPAQKTSQVLVHDLPLFLNWLETVQAGAESANTAIGSRREALVDREAIIRKATEAGPGIINDKQDQFNQQGANNDEEGQWNTLKSVVTELVVKLTGISDDPYAGLSSSKKTPSPFADVYGSNAGAIGGWILIGVAPERIPLTTGFSGVAPITLASINTLAQLRGTKGADGAPIVPPGYKPDFNVVRKQLALWVQKAKELVALQRPKIRNQDTILLITKAATVQNDLKSSPYRSLLTLLQFTDAELAIEGTTGALRIPLKDTRAVLHTIICDIHSVVGDVAANNQYFVYRAGFKALEDAETFDCPVVTATPDADAIVKSISEIARLDNGTVFLRDRLEWSLRNSLLHLTYDNQSGISASDAAILLARNDYVADLQNYTNKDYQLISEDIEFSQGILKSNLRGLATAFGPVIGQILAEYRERGDQKQVAKMCSLLLAIPEWPTSIDKNLCLGSSMQSIFDQVAPLSVGASEINQGFEDRVCNYFNFEQRNKLYQNMIKIRGN